MLTNSDEPFYCITSFRFMSCNCSQLKRILFLQKDSNAVKEALDQLNEVGWAKRWSSQPYVSRRMVSLHYKCEVLGSGTQYISHTYKPMHTCTCI